MPSSEDPEAKKGSAESEFYDEILAKLAAAGILEIVKDSKGQVARRNGKKLYRGTGKSRSEFNEAFDRASKEALHAYFTKKARFN